MDVLDTLLSPLPLVFQNLFPERGLKPISVPLRGKTDTNCFSEPIPRKGTETEWNSKHNNYKWQRRFSEPIPRKGTETRLAESPDEYAAE